MCLAERSCHAEEVVHDVEAESAGEVAPDTAAAVVGIADDVQGGEKPWDAKPCVEPAAVEDDVGGMGQSRFVETAGSELALVAQVTYPAACG